MKKTLRDFLEKNAVSIERKVNTNNGWGFGGAIKTIYHLNSDYSVHTGTAYYRHARPSRFTNLRDEFGSIVHEESRKNADVFERVVILKHILES